MSWAEWKLPPLGFDAPLRSILLGGGFGWVLDVSAEDAWEVETLDARWSVSAVRMPIAPGLLAVGDIAIWRGYGPGAPGNSWVWNGPTRVLAVERTDAAAAEVVCLEDAMLASAPIEDDALEFILTDFNAGERLPDLMLWRVLQPWRLFPLCARCGGEMWPITYGLTLGEPEFAFAGGCVTSPDDPTHQMHAMRVAPFDGRAGTTLPTTQRPAKGRAGG